MIETQYLITIKSDFELTDEDKKLFTSTVISKLGGAIDGERWSKVLIGAGFIDKKDTENITFIHHD